MRKQNGIVALFGGQDRGVAPARVQSHTDWAKVGAMSEARLRASIAADPDDLHAAPDWTRSGQGLAAAQTADQAPPRRRHPRLVPRHRQRLLDADQQRAAGVCGGEEGTEAISLLCDSACASMGGCIEICQYLWHRTQSGMSG